MTGRSIKKPMFAVLLGLLALAGGCRTPEEYQDEAVQDARVYLLKQVPELSLREVAFVRYNKPVILAESLIGNLGSIESTRLSTNLAQICIVWKLPQREELFMVYGVSPGSMQNWSPERLIRKRFLKPDQSKVFAMTTARNYILNNLFYSLQAEEYNHTRFADPMIVATNFELDSPQVTALTPPAPDPVLPEEATALDGNEDNPLPAADQPVTVSEELVSSQGEKTIPLAPPAPAPVKNEEQYTLYWSLPGDPDHVLAVIGRTGPDMQFFNPVAGGRISLEMLKTNQLPAPVETTSPEKDAAL